MSYMALYAAGTVSLLLALLPPRIAAARGSEEGSTRGVPRRVKTAFGPLSVTLSADPQVEYHRDTLLTITVTAPSEVDVTLPPLHDRLQGFRLREVFDREPVTRAGTATYERRARLTPLLADAYRLAPMAIVYRDRSYNPPREGWLLTRPVTFQPRAPAHAEPGADIRAELHPVRIPPSPAAMALTCVACLLAAACLVLLLHFAARMRSATRLRRMTPRERALRELADLLALDFMTAEQFKEFYIRLTMIVRRYIEKLYGIHAPEQTTDEFIVAASADPRFHPGSVDKLKAFLGAADLVKYAGRRPSADAADEAARTAREYIESDRGTRTPEEVIPC
jgi:hypothetical protein